MRRLDRILFVCAGHRSAEYAAEGCHILAINRTRGVAGLELKQELGADAANRRAGDEAFARQRPGRIGDPIDRVGPNTAVRVKEDDVNINSASLSILKDEVPWRGVL